VSAELEQASVLDPGDRTGGAAMELVLPTPTRSRLDRFITKRGERVLVSWLDAHCAEGCQRLVAAYLAYQPRDCFQGLPPLKDEVCREWVWHLVHNGVNLLAVSDGKEVAGHVALLPEDGRSWEMMLAVWPSFQNLGIGTRLVHCAVRESRRLGATDIALSVEAANVRARHVYEKCGFRYCRHARAGELVMVQRV
jgi:ribosomal protein S18 acetylase RimI-like enzyme